MKKMLGPILMIVSITVGLIVLPILMDAAHSITTNANIADFTGVSTFVVLIPFLVLIGMLFTGGFLTFQEVKGKGGGGKKSKK